MRHNPQHTSDSFRFSLATNRQYRLRHFYSDFPTAPSLVQSFSIVFILFSSTSDKQFEWMIGHCRDGEWLLCQSCEMVIKTLIHNNCFIRWWFLSSFPTVELKSNTLTTIRHTFPISCKSNFCQFLRIIFRIQLLQPRYFVRHFLVSVVGAGIFHARLLLYSSNYNSNFVHSSPKWIFWE